MNPDLPVLNGMEEVLHVKFVCKRAAVLFETANDLYLLDSRQKPRGSRVVLHIEESKNC